MGRAREGGPGQPAGRPTDRTGECVRVRVVLRSLRSLTHSFIHSHSLGVIIRETANIYPDSLHLFISIPLPPAACTGQPRSCCCCIVRDNCAEWKPKEAKTTGRRMTTSPIDAFLRHGHGSPDRTAEGWSAEAEGLCDLTSLHCGRTERGRWTHVRIQRDSRWMVGKFQLAIKVLSLSSSSCCQKDFRTRTRTHGGALSVGKVAVERKRSMICMR